MSDSGWDFPPGGGAQGPAGPPGVTAGADLAVRSITVLPNSPYAPATGIVPGETATSLNPYNVRAYGAKGDGIADDTVAIQAAITAAVAAGGGVVFFPRGTFLLNTATTVTGPARTYLLNLAGNNVAFQGSGREATILKVGTGVTTDGARVISADSNALVAYCSFEDFTIDGNAAALGGTMNLMVGISLVNTQFCRHIRVRVKNIMGKNSSNFEGACFDSFDSFQTTYTDCDASGTLATNAGAVGFSTTNSTGTRYENCTSNSSANSSGFSNHGCDHLGHTNCTSYLNALYGFNTETGRDIFYVNCVGGGKTNPNGQSGPIAASTSLGNTLYGFNVYTTTRGSWVNCTARSNVIHGWACSTTSTGLRIIGGSFADNTQAGIAFIQAVDATNTRISGGPMFSNNAGGDLLINAVAYTAFGAIAVPAIPASTTTFTNPFPFDASIHISGGTLTAATQIGGFTTGLLATPQSVLLPAGQTIKLTYSVAPTWVWYVA